MTNEPMDPSAVVPDPLTPAEFHKCQREHTAAERARLHAKINEAILAAAIDGSPWPIPIRITPEQRSDLGTPWMPADGFSLSAITVVIADYRRAGWLIDAPVLRQCEPRSEFESLRLGQRSLYVYDYLFTPPEYQP